MEFKFHFSLSEQDYIDFNMFHTFASKTGKKQYQRIRWLTAGIFLLTGFFYLLLYGFNSDGLTYLCVFALAAVFAFLIAKPSLRASVKRQVKFLKKQGKLPFSSEASMTFTENCFTEQTDTNKSEYSYSILCDVYLVNDRMLYLYMDTVRAFLLPVAAFKSKAQFDSFMEFIRGKTVPVTTCDFERSPYMEPLFTENFDK